jgi:nitric oxide reductase large subunit
MSETNPIESVLGFQRTILEQTHKATLESLDAQKTAFQQFADGLETLQQFQSQGADLSRNAIHTYLDSIEQANPEADIADIRELVDEQFEAAEETQAQSWETVIEAVEESTDGFEQTVETYSETVDNSFDSFLETHEEIEANTVSVAEQIEESTPDADELAN